MVLLAALERIVTLMAEAEGVPTELLDPITGKIMKDPVEWVTYDLPVRGNYTILKGTVYDRDTLYRELVQADTQQPKGWQIMGITSFKKRIECTPRCSALKAQIELWNINHQPKRRLWQDNPLAKANTISRLSALLGRGLTPSEIHSLQFAYHDEPVDSDWQLPDHEIKQKALSLMKDYSPAFRYRIYKECSQLLFTSQQFSNVPDLYPANKTLAQTCMNTALADDSSLTTLTQYVCNIAALFKEYALSSVQKSNIVTRWNGLTIHNFNTHPPP